MNLPLHIPLFLTLFTSIMHNAQETPPNHFIVNNYVNTHATNNNESTNALENTHHITQHMSAVNIVKEYGQKYTTAMIDRWYSHKYYFCFSGLALLYLAGWAKVYAYNTFIKKEHLWAKWHSEKDIGELTQQPSSVLIQHLMRDIQHHYINNSDPTNCNLPLVEFMQDTTYEKQQLEEYNRMIQYLTKYHMSFLYPFFLESSSVVTSCCDRLAFVHHLFISWLAHYKIEQLQITTKTDILSPL